MFAALVVGYFAYHSMKGDHGLNAYAKLSSELAKAEEVLKERRGEREIIEHRTNLLRPDNLDLDILDERARAVLNLINDSDRVILDQ
jgi:cell division protein FtsB